MTREDRAISIVDLISQAMAVIDDGEQAEQLVSLFTRLTEKADPRILARQADMTVFAPDTITPGQASTYWATVDDAVGGLNRSVSVLSRIRGSLSVRSFRRQLG